MTTNTEEQKVCETCGNEYEKAFQVKMGERLHTFDCFECAIQMLAPHCAQCGTRVIGHGVENEGEIYCCNQCASSEHALDSVHP